MGKNYSMNNASGKRKESDFYETPYSMTQQLIDTDEFFTFSDHPILEPASGSGAIAKILKNNGFKVISRDLKFGNDFFDEKGNFEFLITNPPYSIAHKWILKCKKVCTFKFALLLPLSYLHGQKRYEEIWSDNSFPLSRVYVFTRYPLLGEALRDDGKYNTGMQVYAWFVWKKVWKTSAEIRWLDNNKYVLTKKDI